MTTSTDAMDTEEGDAITKMILDKTEIKARWMQRRSRLIKGWDMEPDDDHYLYLCPKIKMKIGW